MTSQGTAHGRFERAIHRGHVQAAEMAAREMGVDELPPLTEIALAATALAELRHGQRT
jgi:hypothetical protein